MGDPAPDDAELLADLVRDAGTLAARMRRAGELDVARKTSVSDVVSAADTAAERLVLDRLQQARPDDGVVGEEGAARPSRSGRVWHVDPVDGTYNFVSGLPEWCSAAALVDGDDVVLGAVFQPAADELWLGGPGRATTCNGRPVAPRTADRRPYADVSVVSYLHPTTTGDDGLRETWLAAVAGAATVRMLGSGSVELAAVAAGRLGVWVQHDSLSWDWWPGAALVRGAGGVTRDVVVGGHRWRAAGPRTAVADVVAVLEARRDLAAAPGEDPPG